MVNIKKFFDKLTHLEGKNARDVVMPMADARALRDEIAKLLGDLHELQNKDTNDNVVRVEITGGKFK